MILLMVRLFLISNHIYVRTEIHSLEEEGKKAHANIYLQLLPKYVRNQTMVLRRRRYISKKNVRLSHLFGCTKKTEEDEHVNERRRREKKNVLVLTKEKAKRQTTDREKEEGG